MNKNRRGLSRLLPFLRPQLKTLLLCLLMVLLVNAAELAKPYILEVVIDRYLTAGRPDQGLTRSGSSPWATWRASPCPRSSTSPRR